MCLLFVRENYYIYIYIHIIHSENNAYHHITNNTLWNTFWNRWFVNHLLMYLQPTITKNSLAINHCNYDEPYVDLMLVNLAFLAGEPWLTIWECCSIYTSGYIITLDFILTPGRKKTGDPQKNGVAHMSKPGILAGMHHIDPTIIGLKFTTLATLGHPPDSSTPTDAPGGFCSRGGWRPFSAPRARSRARGCGRCWAAECWRRGTMAAMTWRCTIHLIYMYILLYIYIYMYMYIHIYIYTHTFIYIYIYMYIHIYMCVYYIILS